MSTTLPPGPRMPKTLQTALAVVAGPTFLHRLHRRFGDVFTLRLHGIGTMVQLADPDDIRTVLRGDPAVFEAGKANAILGEVLGAHSVLVVDGEPHKRSRGMMLPAFHGDSVRRQVEQMVRITADEVATWPVGTPFPLLPRMQAITLEVILRTVIGVHDDARLAALREALPPMVDIGNPFQLLPPPRRLRNVGPWKKRARIQAKARGLLQEEIERSRTDPEPAQRTDVLAMMVRAVDESGEPMSDRELSDQLVTLLLAGHETTATALAWTCERLTRDPAQLAKVVAAADEDDEPYLDAVCKESLRIRPVVSEIGRVLSEPAEVAGYRLPAGVMVVPNISLVHRHAHHAPDEFQPERFLDRTDQSTWMPFGGGIRRCLGATFAQVEMRVVLREVLRRVELAPTSDDAERARPRHVTLVPGRGAMTVVRARRPVLSRR